MSISTPTHSRPNRRLSHCWVTLLSRLGLRGCQTTRNPVSLPAALATAFVGLLTFLPLYGSAHAEPDDTPSGAYLITLGAGEVAGLLSSITDMDWHKVNVTATGTLSWRVRSMPGGPGITYIAYHNPGQTSGSPNTVRTFASGDNETVDFPVTPGTYYMVVTGNASLGNGRYAVRADWTPPQPPFTVTTASTQVTEASTNQNCIVHAGGSVTGTGNGTLTYQWIVRKPDTTTVAAGGTLSATMTSGSATIPAFTGLPTDLVGQYTAWFRITSPSTLDSASDTYSVTAAPAPDLLSITGIPSSLLLGQSFTVTSTAQNLGGVARPGSSITASVLYDDGTDDLTVDSLATSGWTPSASYFYAPNQGTVNLRNGGTVPPGSRDWFIEVADDAWANNTEHSMSFRVTPNKAGTVWVRVRTTMNAGCNWLNDWSASGGTDDVDQQGWEVKRFPVAVGLPSDLRGFECAGPASASWGQTIALQCQVTNQNSGATASGFVQRFYLSADSTWGDADDVLLGSYTHPALSGNSAGAVFTVNLTLPSAPPSGEYGAAGTYRIGMKTDADNQVSNESNPGNNGPGALAQGIDWDSTRVTEPLPDGKWTIVVHGLCSSSYDALLQGSEFYGAMSSGLAQLSANFLPLRHNVGNGTVGYMGGAEILPGNLPLGKHYVLFVDWTEVSDLANSTIADWLATEKPTPPEYGEDGYAEATADAVFALIRRYNAAADLHQLIGHSRGVIVCSKIAQRLLSCGFPAPAAAYLEGEGGDNILGMKIYSDASFYAWQGMDAVNYFDMDSQPYGQPDKILGPPDGWKPGIRADPPEEGFMTNAVNVPVTGQNSQVHYGHRDFWRYFTDNLRLTSTGGFAATDNALNGNGGFMDRYQPQAAPAWDHPFATGGFNGATNEAPAEPDPRDLVNGDFQYQSTAGWSYHGGGGNGVVKNSSGNWFLELDGTHTWREHNWMFIPPDQTSLQFRVNIQAAGGTSANPEWLRVAYTGHNGGANVWSLRLNVADPTWGTTPTIALPAWAAGDVGKIELYLEAAAGQEKVNARVQIDDVRLAPGNGPPTASLTTPSSPQSGNISASYMLADAESDTCSITVQWRPDGGSTWNNVTPGPGGDGSSNLTASPGGTSHTFVWASGSDIVNANNVNVKIRIIPRDSEEGAAGESGLFTVNNVVPPQTGSVKVTLTPQGAIDAGALWRIDNTGPWYQSAQTIGGIAVGPHTVTCTIVPGWDRPGEASVTVNSGQVTEMSLPYVQQVGSLRVTISPVEVVSAGAQWQVDAGEGHNSGDTVSGLAVGNHTVHFSSILNWNSPADQTVGVASGVTVTTSGTYGPIYPISTIQTVPAGLVITVDGTNYTAPRTFNWAPGSLHTSATVSPQSGGLGTNYLWSSWSYGGGISNVITAAAIDTNYTANFTTQYYLTMNAGTGGTVSPPNGWYNSGTNVVISATASNGYQFSGWMGSGSGSYRGPNQSASVTMNGSITEQANFEAVPATGPFAATQPAAPVAPSMAVLNGMATPNGLPTTAWFEWGGTSSFGQRTLPVDVGSGVNVVRVTSSIGNLGSGVAFHCRLVASNALGIAYGADRLFTTGGRVTAWGQNNYGQTVLPDGVTNVVGLSAGAYHSLALTPNGTVRVWGNNVYQQQSVPANLTNAAALATDGCSGWNCLALKADSTLADWGIMSYEQAPPLGLTNIIAASAGSTHCLALRSDGTVVAWGGNGDGQTNVPPGLSNVVAVAGGGYFSMALKADGTIAAWGRNTDQELAVPTEATNIIAIAGGEIHALALRADGSVLAWGGNDRGQRNVPADATNAIAIAAGGKHCMALLPDGTVMVWGSQSSSPGLTNVVLIAGGGWHCLAATTLPQPPITNLTASLKGGGAVDVQFNGTPGYSYVLQAATNLAPPVIWQPVYTNLVGTDGNWIFTDTNTLARPARFYRATSP